MNKHCHIHTSQHASGRVKVIVLNPDGSVHREHPWQKNLILNQGLNDVCSTFSWADAMLSCAAGTGVTATSVASGTGVTGAGAATTFTNTTPGTFDWTVNSAVGDMIRMTSGAQSGMEARITGITDANNVSYTPSQTMGTGEFAVYHTAQTGLTTESKRTSTYLTGAGNCDATLVGSAYTLRRTFDFTAEVGSVTYNELGFSNMAGAGANLFSRIKLATGVSLVAGQQLRVVYALTITLSPTTSTGITASITGWPVAPSTLLSGFQSLQAMALAGINPTTGATRATEFTANQGAEPFVSSGISIFISPVSTALAAFNATPVDRTANKTSKAVSLNTYTALDFYREKTTTFAIGEANRTDFRSIGWGHISNGEAYQSCAFCLVFDEAQTKTSLYTLTLTFRISVGRTLA